MKSKRDRVGGFSPKAVRTDEIYRRTERERDENSKERGCKINRIQNEWMESNKMYAKGKSKYPPLEKVF